MIAGRALRIAELDRTPDLADVVAIARDAGREVCLIERPMPDAVSVAAVGRAFDLVAVDGGVALEDGGGDRLDEEPGIDRVAAAARLWRRFAASSAADPLPAPATGLVAVGGFAYRPDREPAGAWSGFPALLLRVPELTVTRVRGRTFVSTAEPGAEAWLDELPQAVRAPSARRLEVQPVRNVVAWTAAVETAAARLRAHEADKVVLAREVMAHGDGVIAASAVVRSLRAAYPSCFIYLITGADGTAFAGASPELLIRRMGATATAQPMAGSVARGAVDEEDAQLARRLLESTKDGSEHELVSAFVAGVLRQFSDSVDVPRPEVVKFTNIQHLATTATAHLTTPPADALQLAAALHPTPAVGGWPRIAADELIDDLEAMERGWYAGAVGWIDARGDGEFAVALRCGLLWEDGARLYAGVGVMPDSDPAQELAETELKFKALLGALV